MQDSSGLNVDTEKVDSLGNDLISLNFDANFDDLKNKMSTITNSWLDVEGTHFSDTFSSFMDDAKKINTELVDLGKFAKSMSSEYDEIVQSYSSMLDKLG